MGPKGRGREFAYCHGLCFLRYWSDSMKKLFRLALSLCTALVTFFSLPQSRAQSGVLTVQAGTPPPPPVTVVNHGATWHYRRGTNEPQANWRTTADASLDVTWLSGPGGLGYGDAGIVGEATTISGMRNVHTTLYVRREFQVTNSIDAMGELRLIVDYDDGFVAYLDGTELTRRNAPGAAGSTIAFNAVASGTHEASCCNAPVNPPTTISLGTVGSRLDPGAHVLAFIALNDDTNSSDLHLIPDLVVAETQGGGLVNNGWYAISTSNSVVLTGSNTIAGSTRVTINGDPANYNSGAGTWTKEQSLQPGWNQLYIAAIDSAGNVLSNITQDMVYETSRMQLGGTLASSVLVSNRGTVLYVTNSIVVPTNVTFEVANGAVVLVTPGQSMLARNGGHINVHGTFDDRVYFHANGAANTLWGPLGATGSNSVLEVKFANVARAQVNATTNAYGLIEDSELHDFDPGSGAGTLGRPLMMCNFAGLFEARRNHYWNYYETLVRNGVIHVEECLFEHITGDALDFDSAQPGSFVRRCTFRHGTLGNVDAVDVGPGDLPGSTDTRIENCIMWNFPFDKGVSVGDDQSSHGIIVSNCLIYGCQSGVMAKDLCDVSVRNCTIVENTSGFTNYNKSNQAATNGAGIITNSYNNILWNNITTIGLANDGRVYADHNDFGNTNWPGDGNIDTDPLFINASARNYRLQPGSPCIGTGRDGATMGMTYPLGGIPAAPLRLAVMEAGTNALMLAWVDDSQNEDGVIVQRSTNAVTWEVLATLPPESTNYSDAAAVLGQKYYYRVQYTNYVGLSPYSNPVAGMRQPPILYVGGTISLDTIWSAGITVVVTSSVTVASGVTLTIQPGVTVLINQGLNFTVNGLLIAEGTEENHIVFTRNAGATSWGTLDLLGSANTHRLVWVDIDRSTGNIDATGTAIYLQHVWWTNTTAQLLDMSSTSVTLLDSYIPGGFGNEPVHFNTMPANGYALIQGNIFGAPSGYNDSVDFTGGNRPGPIVQFINNVFLAAVDDCFDMDGTDAHIEGNIFMNVHQDAVRDSTANAVSTGSGSGLSELVVVRNIFYNCDHALLLKDMGSSIFENNTVVTIQTNQFAATRAAYVQFGEPHRGVPGGRGILMNGNILWDLHSDTPFIVFTNGTMFMVANDNIIHGTNMMFGGNLTNDPMFVNWQTGITHLNIRSNLALLPGSPAIGTGPNGLDRGALVPGGASISGEPAATTTNRSATLKIAGPGIYSYRWKLNNGPWSSEVQLTNNFLITATMFSNAAPITLSNLSNGTYTVYVIGKNSAGAWQDTNSPTVSKTWTVGEPLDPDTDGDGIPDSWELAYGLNPTNAADATLDADVDGLNNLNEYLAGTNPTNALSRLALSIDGPVLNTVGLHFEAVSNKSYTLQYRPSLSTGSWLRLQDFTAEGTNRTILVTNDLTDPTRFFRIVTPQAP
jgi:hypothetical protein